MMHRITEAIDEADHMGDTPIFLREDPLENGAMDGRMQSENPKILQALKRVKAGKRAESVEVEITTLPGKERKG